MVFKIVILASGSGTNLQAIIDCCEQKILNAQVVGVIVNKSNIQSIERAKKYSIPYICATFDKSKEIRKVYDRNVAKYVNSFSPDLVVLAGWMHIFTYEFLNNVSAPVINLHPALPGEFPGADGVGDAFKAFKEGKITRTGVMVHYVVEEVDGGNTINSMEVPIFDDDTVNTLRNRIRYYEKFVLIEGIQKVIFNTKPKFNPHMYLGKVRDVYHLSQDVVALVQTDRQSAFDQHICDVPNKGLILTEVAAFWFNKTKHIIPNHYLYHFKNVMFCKRYTPFKVEVVVRGYITGSTKTSLWTHYSKGDRVYCGITFPDNLIKNQKLDTPVITPTTKGETDEPVSGEEIVKRKLMTEEEWKHIKYIALMLFDYGQEVAREKGLILVDTKYEFGKDKDGKIYLIDEIHTCDSSRYWLHSTYKEQFEQGLEPKKFDKDIVREYIRSKCDPYNEPLPVIPKELINKASKSYQTFYNILTK